MAHFRVSDSKETRAGVEYTPPYHSKGDKNVRASHRAVELQRPLEDHPVRTSVRFPLRLAIQMETEDGWVDAVTENISANGLLFTGVRLPPVDSRVSFTMCMPSALMGTEADVMIYCSGRIVRHQQQDLDAMAAAVIDEYFLKA